MQPLNLVIKRTRQLEALHEEINNGLTEEILHADLYHEIEALLTDAKECKTEGGTVDLHRILSTARENVIRACMHALDEAMAEAVRELS